MATFTVHAPAGEIADAARAGALVYVPEKGSWAALLVPFLWAPWHRLWWVFLGWLAVTLALEGVDRLVDPTLAAILSAAFMIWFALAAAALRRWSLEGRGYRLVGVVEASDAIEAECRFLGHVADPARPRFGEVVTPTRPRPEPAPVPASRRPTSPDLPPVVGWAVPTPGDRP